MAVPPIVAVGLTALSTVPLRPSCLTIPSPLASPSMRSAFRPPAERPFSPASAAPLTRWRAEADAVRSHVGRALDAIKHRGPDAQSVWMSDDSAVALGHVRLALLDLTPTGTQPLHHWASDTHIAVNGELYGWRETRRSAEAEGWEFSSTSDSEVALYLYARHGPSFPQLLRGEFAFALWDGQRRLLVAGRDRYGVKPLYWTRYRDQLLLASEIKALFAYGVPAVWDEEALATGGQLYGNRTVFRDIHKVPPAHFLVATPAGGVSFQRYYDVEYPDYADELRLIRADSRGQKEEAAVQETRRLLVDAVQQRMIADVRVGVYLSGGLDSCSLLGVAASLSSTPVEAFTISFADQARFDEAEAAKAMAKHANANLHIVEATPAQLAEHFEAAVYHVEAPVFNLNGVAKLLLSDAVRKQGEGSDEIFAGYSFFRHDFVRYHLDDVVKAKGLRVSARGKDDYLRALRTTDLLSEAECGRWLADDAERMRRESERLLHYTPAMLTSIPFIHSASWLSRELRERFAHLHPLYFHLASSPSFDQRFIQRLREGLVGRLSGSLYLEVKTMLANILLEWLGDREEMAHSVEGRVPFLDHPLVDFVNRQPLDLKIRLAASADQPVQLVEKYLLKRAAAPFLPQSIVDREKHPFLAPPTLLNAHSLMYHYIRQTVRSRDMEELRGVVDVDRVRHALDAIDREVAEGRKATLDLPELLRLEQWLLMICSLNTLRRQFNVRKE